MTVVTDKEAGEYAGGTRAVHGVGRVKSPAHIPPNITCCYRAYAREPSPEQACPKNKYCDTPTYHTRKSVSDLSSVLPNALYNNRFVFQEGNKTI